MYTLHNAHENNAYLHLFTTLFDEQNLLLEELCSRDFYQ